MIDLCLEWLRSKICDNYINPPRYLEDIDSTEIISIIDAEFLNGIKIISDYKYKTTTVEELIRFLDSDITDKYNYVSEYFDCNNFSFSLMGRISNPSWGCLPFGVLYIERTNGSLHALNCFIDKNRELWVIEPQTDDVFKASKSWKCVMLIM